MLGFSFDWSRTVSTTDEDFYNTVLALSELSEKQYRGVQQLIAAFDE